MRRVLALAAAALCLAGCGGGGADDVRRQRQRAGARDAVDRDRRPRRHLRRLRRRAREGIISRGLDGYRGVAVESSGSVQNLLRLRDGKVQIALTLGDTALDAVEGREAFDRPVPMRALAQIYPSYVQLVTAGTRRHRHARGPDGQARQRRLARLGHPGGGRARARRRGHRPAHDVPAQAARRRRVDAGARAGLDRRVLLVRRRADGRRRGARSAQARHVHRPQPLRARAAGALGRRLRDHVDPRRRLRAAQRGGDDLDPQLRRRRRAHGQLRSPTT